MSKPNKLKPLLPPDKKQCQALIPNGNTFMTLGGRPGRVRCTNVPMIIAKENNPGEDGRKGSMSLCLDCSIVFVKQLGADYATMQPIQKPKAKKKAPRERSSRGSRIDGSTRMGE